MSPRAALLHRLTGATGIVDSMAGEPKSILERARHLKHQAVQMNRRHIQPSLVAVMDWYFAQRERFSPYSFDPGFYPHNFVRRPSLPCTPSKTVPRQIWTAWLGSGAMNDRRTGALDSIRRSNRSMDVEVITDDSFADFLIPGHPIHPGYQFLGPVQRSDYIRCYLLHHHGGVWMDLKETTTDWSDTVDALDADPTLWVAGYPEATVRYVARGEGTLGLHMRRHYTKLLGGSAYAMKATSPFTSDWFVEQHARLDYWLGPLSRFPCTSPYEIPRDHPIGWGEIAFEITHPLSLKHGSHILLERALTPSLRDYR